MPRKLTSSLILAAVLVFAALAPGSALAASATFDGISTDGSVIVFSTTDQMLKGDTDSQVDVYVRTYDVAQGEYVTRQASLGPGGGNDARPANYDGMSGDGTEIFFSTDESLVKAADTDSEQDVYVRNLAENRTLLVSAADPTCTGACGNGSVGANFATGGAPLDGGEAFFETSEPLSAADQDGAVDVYVRDIAAQTTTLVSAGDTSCAGSGCGNQGGAVSFRGTDDAGDKAFFTSSEALSSADGDGGESDIYERDLAAERTFLVSVATACPIPLPPGETCEPTYGGASSDGTHVFYESYERGAGDSDASQDVYGWSGAAPVLISTGPDGGNGLPNATYAGTSANGDAAYFRTDEPLDTSADTDGKQDVYRRVGGETELVSAGEAGMGNGDFAASFNRAAESGGEPVGIFTTNEPLTAEDTDAAQDVYERVGESTVLVSSGPDGGNGSQDATFAAASADGSKVFFTTSESLVAQDTDTSSDIYRWSSEGTDLVSGGQINGNGPYRADLQGIAEDGTLAAFSTEERLTEGDADGDKDVYSWNGASTRLVSAANAGFLVLGPPPPALEGTSPPSPAASTNPAILGQAESGALIKIYKTAGCSGEIVAEGTAEELASTGIAVTVGLGSTTFFRATAELEGVVSDCSTAISYTQQDPEPPPPPPGNGESESPPPTDSGGTGSTGDTGSTGGGTGSTGGAKTGRPGAAGGNALVMPVPRITFGPSSKTRRHRVVFRFVDSTGQPGTDFFCRLDRRRWKSCTSPTAILKLKAGRHVFRLKAVNAAGTAASPVSRRFKVVTHR